MPSSRRLPVAALALVLLAVPASAVGDAGPVGGPWTGAWTAAVQRPTSKFYPTWSEKGFDGHSVRQVVRVTATGPELRIRLSHAYGSTPLRLTGATVARAGDGAALVPGTVRHVTFGGARSVTVPAGGKVVSDPVPMAVRIQRRVAVTLYFEGPTGPVTFHQYALGDSYRASGDHRADEDPGAYTERTPPWYVLEGVEVAARPGPRGVVTFGDSLTDGFGATPGADDRYPDRLADRLAASGDPRPVLNLGIGGNRVLSDSACYGEKAVDRFARDVLGQPRAGTVIVLEGTNDILMGTTQETRCTRPNRRVTAAELIEGYRILIRTAHGAGLRIVGATIPPFPSPPFVVGTYDPERVRDEVNHWIRTSGEYDAVADFDRAVADGDHLRPEYDSGDGLHPNAAGYRAMAEAVDLDSL
ncbi:SGNH/GDSL hydrolase family protein [Streptomyces sp. NBC_00094]|uniref:SGNH/GDSL hydrolase family protein n=1 Tax=Streptomyces sp. NBC_00094 TaxID=2903620 RepID=UPI00225074F3|nr:SGNH/GDSL hydrolase family protein [Streptomyces sp. NBC_00094]MCX5391734.1 SGNH/GDSL hydrolase family protein [Streptomyces sp. NBC_00094]